MRTQDILNEILDDASEELKKKWVRKITAHSQTQKKAFHKCFMEKLKKDAGGASYVLAHPHIDFVDIYIVSLAYESPMGCLLVADDMDSKVNVFGGKVRGSTKDWGDVANTVFEILHEQMGGYPTAATLEHGFAYVHADNDSDGHSIASICWYVTDLDYIQRHEMTFYAYFKGKLIGSPDKFVERKSFEYIDISSTKKIHELRADDTLSDNIFNFQVHLGRINSALYELTPVSLSTFKSKLVLLIDYDNDVKERGPTELEPPHVHFPPPTPGDGHDPHGPHGGRAHEITPGDGFHGEDMCEKMKTPLGKKQGLHHHGKIRIRIK